MFYAHVSHVHIDIPDSQWHCITIQLHFEKYININLIDVHPIIHFSLCSIELAYLCVSIYKADINIMHTS